jgi:hypothetical protein
MIGRHINSSTNEFEHIDKYFLHRSLNLASPTSLQCQQMIALTHTTSIMTSAVARLWAVPFALSFDRSLLLITAVIIILIHLHLTSRRLQVWLLRLRLRLRRSLRLHRRRGLGRRLRLRLGRLLLSWGCRCRLFSALLCCEDTRGWLGINLRWTEGWWMVSHFGRVVVLISTSLVICASHLRWTSVGGLRNTIHTVWWRCTSAAGIFQTRTALLVGRLLLGVHARSVVFPLSMSLGRSSRRAVFAPDVGWCSKGWRPNLPLGEVF